MEKRTTKRIIIPCNKMQVLPVLVDAGFDIDKQETFEQLQIVDDTLIIERPSKVKGSNHKISVVIVNKSNDQFVEIY